MNENDRNTSTSRRNALKATAGTFGGLVGYPFIAAGDDTRQIVITRNRDGSPQRVEEVPEPWYNQKEKAERLNEKLIDQQLSSAGVTSIGITTSEEEIGGLKGKKISVGVNRKQTDVATSSNAVPTNVDGIPIETVEVGAPTFQCYEGSYSDLKGGISIESSQTLGTACCRVYNGGTEYLLTVGHLFGDPCGLQDLGGEDVHRNGNKIGEVHDNYREHDTAWIDVNSSENVTDGIVDESKDINGWVTKDGLSTISSNGEDLERRGVTTCDTQCQIYSYDNHFMPCQGLILTEMTYYASTNTGDGDSGGPYYSTNSSGAYLAGIHSGKTDVDCGNLCSLEMLFGAAAYAMNSFANLSFD